MFFFGDCGTILLINLSKREIFAKNLTIITDKIFKIYYKIFIFALNLCEIFAYFYTFKKGENYVKY